MECPFCNTEFKNKYILLKHLKRKYNCKTNYSKDDYIDVINQIEKNKSKTDFQITKPISTYEIGNTSFLDENDDFKCKDCGKVFINKNSIYYHRKNVCKNSLIVKETKIPTINEIDFDKLNPPNYSGVINDVSKLVQGSTAPIIINFINNSTINSNNNSSSSSNNSNTQNIQINDYGKENLSYLKYHDIIEAGPWQTVPRLFEKIHFNPEHKENFNIKIKPNDKTKFIDILFQGKWVKRLKYDELSEKEEKLRNFIIDFAKENHSNIPSKILERILEYEDKMENMDKNSKEYQYILSKLEEIGMKGFVIMEADLHDI
jgi:hypothetical protein